MGVPSSNGINVVPPWVRPGEGFTFPENGDIIKPSTGEEVVIMPLRGLVHDSPIIYAVQKSTRRSRRLEKSDDFTFTIIFGRLIVKLIYATINLIKKIKNS
jgi:hypothetical protein